MKAISLLSLIISSSLTANTVPNEVCLKIDENKTAHKKYPNIATEVENFQNSYNVFHMQEFCFDLSKQYYMQYFLWETSRTIVYGTKCIYEPKIEDTGKVLVYDGESGSTPCLIKDAY